MGKDAAEWQLFLKGLEGKTTVVNIKEDATVDKLLEEIEKINGIPKDVQRVLFSAKQLEYGKGKTLKDYNIQNNSNLFVVLRLKGGSETEDLSPPPKQLDEDVELTDLPDMITWDDDPDSQRAKMPCGHAIGPESLTAFCRSILSSGKFRFYCPYVSPTHIYCGKEWEYNIVRRLAVLTDDEKKEFEVKISENYLRKASGVQMCPGCSSLCERIDKDRRVICPLCTKRKKRGLYEFCWFCLNTWKTPGTADCGNDACSQEDPRLQILKNAAKKEIVGVKNCPSRRACPTCGMLIEHERACKHMACVCGERFCFICLKSAVNGSYQCGSYNTPCTVSPVQKTIPGCD